MAPNSRRAGRSTAIVDRRRGRKSCASNRLRPGATVAANEPLQPTLAEMEVDEPQVRLRSNDGKRFTLTISEASCSNALKSMIESSQSASNRSVSYSNEYINLQSVDGEMLSKVIEWCQVHCGDGQDSNNNNNLHALANVAQHPALNNDDATCRRLHEPGLTEWDSKFLNSLSELDLFKLLHVANYLDVRSLYSAGCIVVAKRWEGKRVEEIRKMYNLDNDFSPDEEHQMLQESKRLGLDD